MSDYIKNIIKASFDAERIKMYVEEAKSYEDLKPHLNYFQRKDSPLPEFFIAKFIELGKEQELLDYYQQNNLILDLNFMETFYGNHGTLYNLKFKKYNFSQEAILFIMKYFEELAPENENWVSIFYPHKNYVSEHLNYLNTPYEVLQNTYKDNGDMDVFINKALKELEKLIPNTKIITNTTTLDIFVNGSEKTLEGSFDFSGSNISFSLSIIDDSYKSENIHIHFSAESEIEGLDDDLRTEFSGNWTGVLTLSKELTFKEIITEIYSRFSRLK